MALVHPAGKRITARRRLSVLIALVTLCLCSTVATAALAATFDPALVISDDNIRAYDSMSQSDIQAFLSSSPVLATYTAVDYSSGKKVLASQIIYNASQKWHINPRVILTLLQKEQSLLTRSKSSLITKGHPTLDWALGMGCPDVNLKVPSTYAGCIKSGCHTKAPGDNRYPEYRGFGRQIWAASQSLDAYGEKGKTRPGWHHTGPKTETVDWKVGAVFKNLGTPTGSTNLAIKNIATFKLYTYNPSIGAKSPYGDLSSQAGKSWMSGNANFWLIYRKYFGDTFANPAIRPIYRLRAVKTGNYLYTKSQTERYRLTKSKAYRYERVAFSWDTSATANDKPVVRFYNRTKKQFLFTASAKTITLLRTSAKAKTWRYDGVAFRCSSSATSSTPVYQFTNRSSGMYFLTSSLGEKRSMLSAKNRKKWASRGIVFYMAHR
jgi:hypothetical protein